MYCSTYQYDESSSDVVKLFADISQLYTDVDFMNSQFQEFRRFRNLLGKLFYNQTS